MDVVGQVVSIFVALVFTVLPVIAIVVGIPLVFAPASGWTEIAKRFPARDGGQHYRVHFGFATFKGWIGFNGCMRVGSDSWGIAVGTNLLLPIGFKPFFIPWSAVESIVRTASSLGMTIYRIRIKGAPDIDFALRGAAFDAIAADAGAAGVPFFSER